jgi:hypothetical protein
MTTIIAMQGVSRVEFENLNAAAKIALDGVRFSMRYHGKSGAKYAYGSFDLRPVKVDGKRGFSRDEVVKVVAWLREQGYYVQPYGQNEGYVYAAGFSYVRKVVA